MTDILFYLLSALTLVFAVMVVANPFSRNPVTSAMFLVLTIVSMAGLFVLLHAFFLAAIQIMVYAGAVIVLFLFVIMLLDVREEEKRRFQIFGLVTGGIGLVSIALVMVRAIMASDLDAGKTPEIEGGTRVLGSILFTNYVLPFEIMGILLLVAMVGVILLSKKELQ
ncbi:MAG: NADH-quinone oxidoreductase subunit J [Verrucomicrobia subdivision 3 bacterium]|nr:NADH-quinone oxidoreductase subunit J [Limisphaerales bacterium]MCS1415061.1 NADH-quinone oxidoreductase subunit J [Limisphaerales bacterium]